MLLSRRAEACLEWVERAECPGGGIATTVRNGQLAEPYPEVTGYMIPTLLDYGRADLAERCGKWLLTLQDATGAFPDRNGKPALFDTGMILQGLRALGYTVPATMAAGWLIARYRRPGVWRCYHALPAALVGLSVDCDDLPNERVHYRAYQAEGILRLNPSLMDGREWCGKVHPYRQDGSGIPCVCGNIQGAILARSREHLDLCAEWQLPCGGFPSRPGGREAISWAAKYFLDAVKARDAWRDKE